MLHITNGDAALELLRRAQVPGESIAWRDILHEGPVPAGLTLEGMSDVRARYLSSIGAGPFAQLRRGFSARDEALQGARHVVLWFEHDLYDQLQLIQILAALERQRGTRIELIAISTFPGIVPFHGLGQLSAPQIATLWPQRKPVSGVQLSLGRQAWQAFCSADPIAVRKLVAEDLSALPFLRAALERLIEEFPAAPDGLSRTERQILQAVATGHTTFADVFRANQRAETAPFLGDTTVRARIEYLATGRTPLLTPNPLALTAAGRRVIAGEIDARQLNGIDRWIGGVHLVA